MARKNAKSKANKKKARQISSSSESSSDSEGSAADLPNESRESELQIDTPPPSASRVGKPDG
jgi:hypothetical protein